MNTEVSALSIQINIPAAGQPANVKLIQPGPLEVICAQGTASRGENDYPATIWAQLYAELPDPLPSSPPGTAVQGTISQDDQWQFVSIAGADSSDSTPYPTNYLVVWAGYPGFPNISYDVNSTSFLGKASTQTDCD
jgi:hypothetical protein